MFLLYFFVLFVVQMAFCSEVIDEFVVAFGRRKRSILLSL